MKNMKNSNYVRKIKNSDKNLMRKNNSNFDFRMNVMTKILKKMTLNVNVLMNIMSQQQKQQNKNFVAYFSLSFFDSILRKKKVSVFNSMFSQNQERFSFFEMNSHFYQRYFFGGSVDLRSVVIKCVYCFRNDHFMKRNCKDFSDNLRSGQIHTMNRRIFFEVFRIKTFSVQM